MSKRKATHDTLEFKQSSAKLASESEQPISQIAIALGINATTLHGWATTYYPTAATANKNTPSVDVLEENKRLKKENVRLKQERDILKKAPMRK